MSTKNFVGDLLRGLLKGAQGSYITSPTYGTWDQGSHLGAIGEQPKRTSQHTEEDNQERWHLPGSLLIPPHVPRGFFVVRGILTHPFINGINLL